MAIKIQSTLLVQVFTLFIGYSVLFFTYQSYKGEWEMEELKQVVEQLQQDLLIQGTELRKMKAESFHAIKLGFNTDQDFLQLKRTTSCGRFPDEEAIRMSNYWQIQDIGPKTFHIYRAYYDDRVTPPVVKILTMAYPHRSNLSLPLNLTCQFWFPPGIRDDPLISPVTMKETLWGTGWSANGRGTGFLLSCEFPPSNQNDSQALPIPTSVSLVSSNCDEATNNIKIINPPNSLHPNDTNHTLRLGVCVKALDYIEDKDYQHSYKLIEWLELLRIHGVQKVFMYKYNVHENIKKVLDHYVAKGFVEVTPMTLPGDLPTEPYLTNIFLNDKNNIEKQKNEIIPYHDCFYRNRGDFDYLAMMDTNEIMLPKNNDSSISSINLLDFLTKLIKERDEGLEKKKMFHPIGAFCFRTVYFFDNGPERIGDSATIPRYLYMLKHVSRSKNYAPVMYWEKCFHATKTVSVVHHHSPLACIKGRTVDASTPACFIKRIEMELAHLQHFTSNCHPDLAVSECQTKYRKEQVADTTIWGFRKPITENVEKVLKTLGIFVENVDSVGKV